MDWKELARILQHLENPSANGSANNGAEGEEHWVVELIRALHRWHPKRPGSDRILEFHEYSVWGARC